MANTLAFSGDHLTDQEKREQGTRCVTRLLTADMDSLTSKEQDFVYQMEEGLANSETFVPTYRQLNWLKDLVEKYT